jgi:hypothetical protein
MDVSNISTATGITRPGTVIRRTLLVLSGLVMMLVPSVAFVPAAGAASAVKPPIQGLLDRTKLPPSTWTPPVNGYVIPIGWADLQPSAGAPIVRGNAIDVALTQIRKLNAANPGLNLAIKLRVFAGDGAPEWAKNLGGAPISVYEPYDGKWSTVGRFWTPAFASAYQDLQNKLAVLYDSAPEVRDVVISRCTMTYAEPFLRNPSPETIKNLLAAGFTYQADHSCLQQQVDAHKVWTTTHSSLAFNPYQQINADGTMRVDESWTESMMDYCRQSLGERCTLENNSIRHPISSTGANYLAMYAKMKALGGSIAFQTATPTRIGSVCDTLSWAINQGAGAVEIPAGYTQSSLYTPGGTSVYDKRLENGPAASGTASPTAPTGLAATASDTGVSLSWKAATDDVGVACYAVLRDGVKIATTTMAPAFLDSSAAPGTAYTYTVKALDAVGNSSPASAPATTGPTAALTSITLTPAQATVAKGLTKQFAATGTYSDGSTADVTSSVTWASSAGGVATISSGGLASATAAGTTTVSATSASVVGTTTLTVAKAPTAMVANPAVRQREGGRTTITYSGSLSSTTDGKPVVGVTVAITVTGYTGCSAVTAASGRATCSVTYKHAPSANSSYTASFSGNTSYKASSAVGSIP